MSYLPENHPKNAFEKLPTFPDFASPLSQKSLREASAGLILP